MEDELKEQHGEQIKPWQFKKGQSGNPKGRPPGKSLKERTKAMLNAMTEEEEQEFLAGIDKRTIWEMAEGKAKQDTDITSGGEKIAFNILNYGDTNPVQVPAEKLPDSTSESTG